MPRTLDPVLRRMHERANPNISEILEMSAPDSGQVLRRWFDQWSTTPPKVSESPANTIGPSGSGALTLKTTPVTLASRFGTAGTPLSLVRPDHGRYLRGVGWTLATDFEGATLEKFSAKVLRVGLFGTIPTEFALQIYLWRGEVGRLRVPLPIGADPNFIYETRFINWVADPLLPEPARARSIDFPWVANVAEIEFDLVPFNLEIRRRGVPPPSPDRAGEAQYYQFVIEPVNARTDDAFDWLVDSAAGGPVTVAGVGSFRSTHWTRAKPDDAASPWVEAIDDTSPTFKITTRQFPATSAVIYAVTLPTVPLAESSGRIVFDRSLPKGTNAVLELSTAGVGGPWTVVKHGDPVTVKQTSYHLRVTLTASVDLRRAPAVFGAGIEFRTTTDLTSESTVEPLSRQIGVPLLEAAVGEGKATVVRTGRRDYRDPAADIVTSKADTLLELDVYLGSSHPQATRDTWLHVDRAVVSSRTPTPTSEAFSFLSFAKSLKRKIPDRVESISRIHTVVSSTTTQVRVTPNLQGVVAGNEYDDQNYYIRVKKSSQAGVETGTIHTIHGSTLLSGNYYLDFDPLNPLPSAFVAGDELEVHSGRYVQPALSWLDADPADIWWEILTVHLLIPPERIGRGDMGRAGRSGLPPKVTDIAPGDTATQAKRKVSRRIDDAVDGSALINQLSLIMGGCTIEVAGQIVFRQIYPLRDARGVVTVSPGESVKTFDPRDYSALDTPTGREQRVTVMGANYGVDSTSAAQGTPASKTTFFVDADAVAHFTRQDVEELGQSELPDEISAWLYNTADEGLYLASEVAGQVVRACSTGMRVWPWSTVDRHPEIVPGDVVTVITDQYTDYDPAQKIPIRGWWAYPLVVVSVEGWAKKFRGFMLGLSSAIQLRGGPGTLSPAIGDPASTGLNNFRFIESADGNTRTYLWDSGSGVDAVWVYNRVRTLPVTEDPYLGADEAADVTLSPNNGEYPVTKPAAGYARFLQFTPRLAALAGGVIAAGEARRAVMYGPGAFGITITSSESSIGGTRFGVLTVVINDPGSLLHPTTPVRFNVTLLGVTTLQAPSTAPASGTSGTYLKSIALDQKHVITMDPVITYSDGTTEKFGSFSFDFDKRSNVIVTQAYANAIASLTAVFDTDTAVGAGNGEYRVDGGPPTALTIPANLTVTFTVAQSPASRKVVEVRGKNAAGEWGPYFTLEVDQIETVSGGANNTFSNLTNAIFSYVSNQVDLSWTWNGGGTPDFKVYVREAPPATGYSLAGTVTASTYRYTASHDLVASGGSGVVAISFYVQAVSGGVVLATSAISHQTYSYA
jgi:hypothetical protein